MGTNLLFAAMIACTGENMVQHLSGFPRSLVMLDGGVLTACALGAGPAIATHPASEVCDVYLDGISGRYPGDPDGAGRATLWFDESNERECARLDVWEVEEPIEVSLYISPEGHVGPLVVPLRAPDDGYGYACCEVPRAQIEEIQRHPTDFYIAIRNDDFPRGALRGQLDTASDGGDSPYLYRYDGSDLFYHYDYGARRYYHYDESGRASYEDLDAYSPDNDQVFYDEDSHYFYYVEDQDGWDDDDGHDGWDHDDDDDHDGGWDDDDDDE